MVDEEWQEPADPPMAASRKDHRKYSRGCVTREDHEWLVRTVREVAWAWTDPFFVEVGVYHAKTALMILQVLHDELRSARVVNIDPWQGAQKFWRRKCRADSLARNVKRKFFLGTLAGAEEKIPIEPKSVHWIFVDGCHCSHCCLADLNVARHAVAVGGLLLVHDTDPRHAQGPADQPYHKGPKRKFGVLEAIKKAQLEVDFSLEVEVPGRTDCPRGIQCGLRVYRRLT
jgi:hypothetical protein